MVGRRNRKFLYRGYMDTYSTTLDFWLHEMQLVVASTCSEYMLSLLNKLWTACRAAGPVSVCTGHVYMCTCKILALCSDMTRGRL